MNLLTVIKTKDRIISENELILQIVNELTRGANENYWANPFHLKKVINTCKKYEYLIKGIKHEYANWRYMLSICVTDTGCNPNHMYDKNKNKTKDIGIGDLNDCVRPTIEKELPDNLKKKDWFDLEKSIAGRYIWINQRVRMKMPWAYLTDRGWNFYSKVKHYED